MNEGSGELRVSKTLSCEMIDKYKYPYCFYYLQRIFLYSTVKLPGCGRQIMIARKLVEKNTKEIQKKFAKILEKNG